MKLLSYFFIATFWSSYVYAGLYPVSKIDKNSKCSGGTCMVYVHSSMKEIGNITEMIPPTGKYLVYGYREDQNGTKYFRTKFPNYAIEVRPNETLGQVAKRAYETLGLYESFMVPNSRWDTIQTTCPAYAIADKGGMNQWIPWNSVFIPASVCDSPPPPPQWCKITSGDIIIDHGTLNQGGTGNRVDKDIVINCSSPMTAVLHLSSDRIDLAPGVQSILSLPNNGKIIAVDGDTHTTLTSTLHLDKDAKPGSYQGSSVLSINYY